MKVWVSQLTCGAGHHHGDACSARRALSAAHEKAGDHQGSRKPAGRRQSRSTAERRQRQRPWTSYKRFLDLNAGDAALRAEAMRRLGDLNLESSESERIEHELATNEGLRATEAIHLYTALLKTYPNYERNDSVLYQLARAYELNAQPDQALASSDQAGGAVSRAAITSTKRSSAAANCCSRTRLSGGAGRLRGGHQDRLRLRAFYNQSLYKHGWSLFKQGENERSLDSFAGVLDSMLVSKRDPTSLIEIDTLSRAEPGAGRGHVPGHVHHLLLPRRSEVHRRIREAAHAAGRLPRPYSYLLYARLGDLYMEKERYTDAADSYRAFVSQDRNNEKAPLLEMQAIEAYSKGRLPAISCCRARRNSSRTTVIGTAVLAGSRAPQDEPKVVAELKTNLKDVAQYYHAQAQRTKNVADYQEAAKWYRSYLTSSRMSPIRRSPTTCSPIRCSRASNISMPRRNTRSTAYSLRRSRQGGCRRLRGDHRVRQARGELVGPGEGGAARRRPSTAR